MPTILILDDEDAIAELTRSLLEGEGYRVILAPNGREGLRLLAEERPGLVISDVMMPVMDGLAFARAVRADPVHTHLPLILMSAAGKGIVADVPHTAFLAKPFDLVTLIALVAGLLPSATDGSRGNT
ncbi:MAG: response regulator [Chloroflexota bacterium]|nr:response regulator [Chloroflexota bacterium]